MDAPHFDRVTRTVSHILSRRAVAGLLGLAVISQSRPAEARKKRKNCKKRRCPLTSCAGRCPSNCEFCYLRAGSAQTICGGGGTIDCGSPCSSDADCPGTICITQSAFAETAEFSDVCLTAGGTCSTIFACV